jgi:Protein of unknown function (DUF1566)/Immunoglobulin domain
MNCFANNNTRQFHHLHALAMTILLGSLTSVYAQSIDTVSPNSADPGDSNITVTFTLASNPAPPPDDAPLVGAAIGSISGSSVTRVNTSNVSAVFTFPASETPGAKDATVTFAGPQGDVVFTKSGGFTINAPTSGPPVISTQPQSYSIPLGGSVTFTVGAYGVAPLEYQWQKDQTDIGGAIAAEYTIDSVSESDEAAYRCLISNTEGDLTSDEATLTVLDLGTFNYPIVDTAQTLCYGNTTSITAPGVDEAFYGQDAQYDGFQPSYTLSQDGLTVEDNITGLIWQQTPDTDGDGDIDAQDKISWSASLTYPETLNSSNYGGYSDWRLPTIKELYSLILFNGTDPSGLEGDDTSSLIPFIDTDYFDFAYGDTDAGERIIDSQYWSTNEYVGDGFDNQTVFGVNFADGRIKGYGTQLMGNDKTAFVLFVRGSQTYGINSFTDNGDGTVTDQATGLMWSQDDSGVGYNWEDTLVYSEAATTAGYDDWRLPNVKELESIVDYTRSLDTHSSAAIDPIFNSTSIINEGGETDFPYFWSGTTHATYNGNGSGAYVAFGRGLGYMNDAWVDVHGAGCQRSDPKVGDPADYPTGHGPQGDAIRIYNYVRMVRDVEYVAPTPTPTHFETDCWVIK